MATSITMQKGHPFPDGTTVEFIPRTLKNELSGPAARQAVKHKAEGAGNVTAVVGSGGSLAPTGLTANTPYIAYALVGGVPRRVSCYCP